MAIIGVIGLIGSGKGAIADYLVANKGFVKLSFADPVKDAGAAIFGWDRKMLEGDTAESRNWREGKDEFWSEILGYKFTPRLALQLIGTEVGRNYFHPDLWLASLQARYNNLPTGTNVVVDDCRFPNEIEFIHKMGGKLVLVERGERPDWWEIALNQNDNVKDAPKMELRKKEIHPSEWSWVSTKTLNLVGLVDNNGTLEQLKNNINQAIL